MTPKKSVCCEWDAINNNMKVVKYGISKHKTESRTQ